MPIPRTIEAVVEIARIRAHDGVSLAEAFEILVICSGMAVMQVLDAIGLTKPEKKASVDATILAAYQTIRPFIATGWLKPIWWIIDPIIVAAIPHITEAVYQVLKPHLAS